MSIKLFQVELVWSSVEQRIGGHEGMSSCTSEIFTTIENGIERVVELVKENPSKIHYLDLSAQYSKTTKTSDCIVLTAFYTKVLFYDSCCRRFSVNVGCRENILQFDDFAPTLSDDIKPNDKQLTLAPDYDGAGHSRSYTF